MIRLGKTGIINELPFYEFFIGNVGDEKELNKIQNNYQIVYYYNFFKITTNS